VPIGVFLGAFGRCAAQDQTPEKLPSVKKLVELRAKGMIFPYGFSPDSKTLFYSDIYYPNEIHHTADLVKYSLTDGKVIRCVDLRHAAGSVISPNGKLMAVGGEHKFAPAIWDLSDWKKTCELKMPDIPKPILMRPRGPEPLAFSPNCKQLLSRTEVDVTRFLLWDVATGEYRLAGKADELPEPIKSRPGSNSFAPARGAAAQAIAFAWPNGPFGYLLFEDLPSGFTRHLYDFSKDKLIPLKQIDPGFGGPFMRPDLRDIVLPLKGMDLWALQGEGFGGLTAFPFDIWRFRLSPYSGRLVIVPKYAKSPFRIVAEPAGTIAIVPRLPDDLFTRHKAWEPPPAVPGTELVRLADFKGARKITWSFQLSPDGNKLAAVWTDPPRPKDFEAKAIESPSLLIVWDLSRLHEAAIKHRQAKAATLDDWVAAKTKSAPSPDRTLQWFRAEIGVGSDPYRTNAALVALSLYPKEGVALIRDLLPLANAELACLPMIDFLEQSPEPAARKLLEEIAGGRHGSARAAGLAKISLKSMAKK
jgi:hypothetical protein